MQHEQHQTFIDAIHSMRKLLIVFHSAKDDRIVTRTVAPLDFGPHASFKDKSDRYHMWDFSSLSGAHTEPLQASQIRSIETLVETFEPEDIVKNFRNWTPKWHIPRDWGLQS